MTKNMITNPAAPIDGTVPPAQPVFTLQRSRAIGEKLEALIAQSECAPIAPEQRRAIADQLIMSQVVRPEELNRLVETETGIAAAGAADWCPGGSCSTAWTHVHGGDCTTSCSEGGCA